MSFGVPNFGMHFIWKEPLAVRHVIAPDPWHVSSISSKLTRAALSIVPWVILIVLVLALQPQRLNRMTTTHFVALGGLTVFLGLFVGFGMPLMNHLTRRTVRMGENKIMIQSGVRPAASKYARPIIDAYDRQHVASVLFEQLLAKGQQYEVIRFRLK
jgi:hypothetical protein